MMVNIAMFQSNKPTGTTMAPIYSLVSFLLLIGCCYGDDDPVSHLVLLDTLPETLRANSTPALEIRTSYRGEIEFRESDDFKVLLNITAPSVEEAYAVSAELIENKGKLLVQVHANPQPPAKYNLHVIFVVVGVLALIVLLLTIVHAVYWHHSGNPQKLYKEQAFIQARNLSRSSNNMHGQLSTDLLMDDIPDEDIDGVDETYSARRKVGDKKPETILEESEESGDDDITNPKRGYQFHPQVRRSKRHISISERPQVPHENIVLLTNDLELSDDEPVNAISPEELIAGANGDYTPLCEIDDFTHDSGLLNSQSTAKLADPRGNLDINMQTSKSDGDLLGDTKKVSEKEKVIPPLVLPKPKRSSTKGIAIPKRAEPNIYQRGLNLPPQANDLSSSPGRATRVQVHTPEQTYANNSFGHYIELKTPDGLSKSRVSRESNDAYELYTYPADIPMKTFKAANSTPVKRSGKENPYQIPKKPRPILQTGSPTGFDYNKLQLDPPVPFSDNNEPYSPGKFSMLSESSGSDENFDLNSDEDHHNLQLLEESDIDDLPSPINKDGDVLSNTSLPLPSPPAEVGVTQYDPYQISQLSPRLSITTPLDPSEYGTMIAITGSPSPGGPYSKHSVKDSHFVFPPVAPNMYGGQQQHDGWPRRQLSYPGVDPGGEYVGLPVNLQNPPRINLAKHRKGKDRVHSFGRRDRHLSEGERPQERQMTRPERQRHLSASERERYASGSDRDGHQSGSDRESGRTRGYGKKGAKIPKPLHLAMLTTFCVLSLISGVYSALSRDTTVNIVVYVPKSYPYKNSTIISAIGREVKIKNSESLKWFVSPDPILYNFNSTNCASVLCDHACDENTGSCICHHGYQMQKGVCVDINECQTGQMRCPNSKSGCQNIDGSYECLCSARSNLYEHMGQCLDCTDPCPSGRYEIQPCRRERAQPKICKDCTGSCGENFFMSQPCKEKRDAKCLMCQPLCNATTHFEYQQCHHTQNRVCKEKKLLPKPTTSDNILLDDLIATEDADIQDINYYPPFGTNVLLKSGVNSFGSEIWVDLSIKEPEAVVAFKPVNHSDAFSPEDFKGQEDMLKNYCPYPVPYQYELKFIKHNYIFYKGNTSEGLRYLEPCESKPDSFPDISEAQTNSIFCSKPGLLSDVFNEINPEDYKTRKTVWEEKSEHCHLLHSKCEDCWRNCSQSLPRSAKPECYVDDDDTGDSPRLPACYTCCVNSDCRQVCENYHNSRCPMIRCQEGNLVQFQLKPVYDNSDTFYCHVEPVLGHKIMTIEYNILIDRTPFLKQKLDIVTDEDWVKTGRIRASDDLIFVEVDSRVNMLPNFLKLTRQRNSQMKIDVGQYVVEGVHLKNAVIGENTAFIRPDKPFGISKKLFVQQSCEDTTLDNIIIASQQRDPHHVMSDLVSVRNDDGTFLVSNKSRYGGCRFGINHGTSLLRAVRKPARVQYNTLTAEMRLNGTHWVIDVTGAVEECPGVFSLNLSAPGYLDKPIYSFDVGVECPNEFKMRYTIPTGDSPRLSKDFQIQVKDDNGTYILVIHTVGVEDEYKQGSYEDQSTSITSDQSVEDDTGRRQGHLSTLFIAIVCGVVILLLLLLVFGVAWKQGIPEGKLQTYGIRQLVLYVLYVTFQFVYSILVTMTVFVLIVVAVNVDTTRFLSQYNQQRSVTSALSQLELDTMETHLWAELNRQNSVASKTKEQCYSTIQKVIGDVENLRQSIETESIQTIQKQNLKRLITEHSQAALDKFTQDLQEFRTKYSNYEQYILHKLTSELTNTYNSIRDSKWLLGVDYVYNFITINQKLHGKSDMVDFMTWINMQTDMMSLAQNLTLPLPTLPQVSDVEFTGHQSTAQDIARMTPMVAQTTNKWFIQKDGIAAAPQSSNKHNAEGWSSKEIDWGSYVLYQVCILIIDILWVLHRMTKAIGIGRLLLLGYPVYVDAREKKDEKKSNKKPLKKTFKHIGTQFVSTMFIPKLIGTLFVCLMAYFVSLCAHKFVNRKTFSQLGYHSNLEDIMKINENVINARLISHADRINTLEFKMYEEAMNTNIQNHQYVLNLIHTQWKAVEMSHTNMYCNYLARINITASCHGYAGEGTFAEVRPDRCSFAPVIPQLYRRNASDSVKIAGAQLDGFLFNIRKLVMDTSYVMIIYLSAIVIKELLSTVIWIYVKRSGFVSLRIIYETDEAPGSSNNSTANKTS